jgi:hypothetical protein
MLNCHIRTSTLYFKAKFITVPAASAELTKAGFLRRPDWSLWPEAGPYCVKNGKIGSQYAVLERRGGL